METAGGILGLAGFVAIIAGAVLWLRARKQQNGAAKRGPLILVGGLVCATVAGLIAPQVEPGSTPAEVASIDAPPAVRNSGYYPPTLNVEIDLGKGERSGQLISQAGAAVLGLGRNMIAGKPLVEGDVEAINFTVLGRAGQNSGVGRKIAHFTFSDQSLRQLTNAGADADTILDHAQELGTWSPAKNDVVREYCVPHPAAKICETL